MLEVEKEFLSAIRKAERLGKLYRAAIRRACELEGRLGVEREKNHNE